MALVLGHHDTDDPARKIGLPVLALGRLLLVLGQFVPPAELLQEHVIELGVARRDFGTLRVRARFGQQVDAVALDAEIGAEVAAAVHHRLRGVVQVGRTRVLHLRRAVARPRQPEVIAVARPALGTQRPHVEGAHVLHVQLQPLRTLPGVADGPGAFVDFVGEDVLDDRFFPATGPRIGPDVLLAIPLAQQLVGEAPLLREAQHDRVVGPRLEQGLDDLLAPLQRTVGRRARSPSFRTACRREAGRRLRFGLSLPPSGAASPPSRRSPTDTDRPRRAGRARPWPSSFPARASASSARGPSRRRPAGSAPGRSRRWARAPRRSSG